MVFDRNPISLSRLSVMNSLFRLSVLCFFLIGSLTCSLVGHPAADEPRTAASLWHPVPAPVVPEQFSVSHKPWVLREEAIAFDIQLVQILKDAGARPHPSIAVDLFDDLRGEIQVMSTVSRINDSAVVRGRLQTPTPGDFTMIINGTIVAGTFQVGPKLFKVEHVVNGHQRLIEVDPDKMPPE